MNINNKIELKETIDNDYVICGENEDTIIAEYSEATTEVPEEAARARRIVECYNLFVGIEDPEAFFLSATEKAKKWDLLGSEISKCYCNTEGEYDEENPEIENSDLGTIGEMAATAYGWL